MKHPELRCRPRWFSTGDNYFPFATRFDRRWWVLRLNNFPDHPLWTLFVDGRRRFDLERTPAAWGDLPDPAVPTQQTAAVHDALAPVQTYLAYGSEAGRPCDNLYCCWQPTS